MEYSAMDYNAVAELTVMLRARASPRTLLKGFQVYLAAHVQPPINTLSAIVRFAGGNFIWDVEKAKGFLGLIALICAAVHSFPYSLKMCHGYEVLMMTNEYGIEFYGKSSSYFDWHYPFGTRARANIENKIIKEYKSMVRYECDYELIKRREQPRDFPTPRCDKLQSMESMLEQAFTRTKSHEVPDLESKVKNAAHRLENNCDRMSDIMNMMDRKDLFETKAKGRSDGKAKEKILVLIPEMTFVGVESRVLIPEMTFVGVESRVSNPETTFVGVESRVSSPEMTFVESKV
ncbi:chaperone protein DnaJ 49 [Tanacetum coccineum]